MKLSERLQELAQGWFKDTAGPLVDAARELERQVDEARETSRKLKGLVQGAAHRPDIVDGWFATIASWPLDDSPGKDGAR